MKKDEKDRPLNSGERNESAKGSGAIDAGNNNRETDVDQTTSADVKNANAAGMGAMGRNDERLTDHTSNHSGDA